MGEDGIVIVDDPCAPLADKIQAALKGVTDKPVRFIINTHDHGDYTGGNAYFQKQAPIIAHDNARKRLETGGAAGNGSSIHMDVEPADKEGLPIITFDHNVTVHSTGEDIRALYFPAGHTPGDSIIFFPKSNVVLMGDDFVTYGFAFIDVESGGSMRWHDRREGDCASTAGRKDHSRSRSRFSDRRCESISAMLKGTGDAVAKEIKAGKTVDQMKQEKLLEPWKKYSGDFFKEDTFIETLYNSLTGQNNQKFVKHN